MTPTIEQMLEWLDEIWQHSQKSYHYKKMIDAIRARLKMLADPETVVTHKSAGDRMQAAFEKARNGKGLFGLDQNPTLTPPADGGKVENAEKFLFRILHHYNPHSTPGKPGINILLPEMVKERDLAVRNAALEEAAKLPEHDGGIGRSITQYQRAIRALKAGA